MDSYFIYGGRIYKRPSSGTPSLFSWFNSGWFGSTSGVNLVAVTVTSLGLLGLLLLASELLPVLHSKFFYKAGVPKMLGSQKASQSREVEGKGQEEKVRNKLKSLSASISAEKRVPKPSRQRQKKDQELVILLDRLLKNSVLQYCYEVKAVLEKFKIVRNPGYNVNLLRGYGRELGIAVNEANNRTGLPESVLSQLFLLQRFCLASHESNLETNLVPEIARQVQSLLLKPIETENVVELERLRASMETIVSSPPKQMLHGLVSLSVGLNALEQENETIQDARERLARLAGIADELVATKVLLQIINSFEDMRMLVMGKAVCRQIVKTRMTLLRMWPEPVYDDSSSLPVNMLLRAHLLVRREQFRRMTIGRLSVTEMSLWNQILNVCDELFSLCFANAEHLHLGEAATCFVEQLMNLIEFIVWKGTLPGQILVENRDEMSFDNLIMESGFTYRRNTLMNLELVTLLKSSITDHTEAVCVQAVQTIHSHITRIVDGILPGSIVGLSMGESTGNAVIASCGTPQEVDVIVSFILGESCKELVFVRDDVSPSSQEALFDALQNLTFQVSEDILLDNMMSNEDKEVYTCFGDCIEDISRFPFSSVGSLSSKIVKVLTSSTLDKKELMESDIKLNKTENISMIVDPLRLRSAMTKNTVRFFPATGSNQNIVVFLVPGIFVVLSRVSPAVVDGVMGKILRF